MYKRILFSALGAFALSGPALADANAEFFKNSGLTVVVGFGAGGGYDIYSRAIARHMSANMPGAPTIIVRNMPGAGSMTAANYLFNTAPRDGSHIGTFSRSIPTQPLFNDQGVQYETLKFNWLGSPASDVSFVFAMKEHNFRTVQDLRDREMIIPASGFGADSAVYPLVMNRLLGTRIKIVTGYRGAGDFMLAIERGEAHGTGGSSISTLRSARPAWLAENKIDLIVQLALRKHPDYPDVPLIIDYAKDETDRKAMELIFARQEIGYPFVAPPGVPAERVKALQDGFMKTVRSAEFRADAQKVGLEVSPMSGEEALTLLKAAYASPPELIARAREAVVPPQGAK